MLGLYPRLQARSADDDDGGDVVEGADGYNALYGIAVVCLSIFLFCVFAASVAVWKALAFSALAALLLSVAGCFAPKRWFRRRLTSTTELVVTVTATGAARPRAPGCALALANAPPGFAYECPLEQGRGGDQPASTASCVVCSVCLEDVRGGEMVRQVPACRHIFHVECIDMWLHSHWTCPMCRCMISPPPKGSPKAAAAEASDHASAEELPPV